MRITFIQPRYDPKPVGGMKVMYEYANQLAARNHEITIVHPRQLPNASPYPLLAKLRLMLNGESIRHRNTYLLEGVPWYPIDQRIKMLSVPEPTASYVPDGDAIFAAFWATAEYVLDHPPEKGIKFYLLQAYEVWCGPENRVHATWRGSPVKIVVSKWLYEKGLKLGVSADRMVHIPNGIDHAKYRVISPIKDRTPRIAMLYHPLALKGADDGIRALEKVRNEFPALQCVLFGVYPRPVKLPVWIEYYSNPSQDELISNIYNGSSILLSSSWEEGFGLPHAEAMACGCAVVSTDSGGVRDFAEHEVTALLSPAKQPQALAENILRLHKDDELRIRIAQAGHERIQEFTWERSVYLLEQCILDNMEQTHTKESS